MKYFRSTQVYSFKICVINNEFCKAYIFLLKIHLCEGSVL